VLCFIGSPCIPFGNDFELVNHGQRLGFFIGQTFETLLKLGDLLRMSRDEIIFLGRIVGEIVEYDTSA